MATIKRYTVFLLLVLGLTATAVQLYAQDRPAWAKDLPNLPQRPGWYQGLGSEKSTANADDDWQKAAGRARAQIGSQIRVRIQNTVARTVQETAAGKDMSLTDAYASTTEQITTATLEAIVIERWFDEDAGIIYAYGAIAQAEVERRFRERMEDASAAARVYHLAGRKAVENNDPYTACGQYLEAMKVISLAEASLERTISASLDDTGPPAPVYPALQSQFCAILSRLQFDILGGDKQPASRNKALPVPLRGRLTFRGDRGPVPVTNALLAVSVVAPATGVVPKDVRTDAAGEFTVPVNEIKGGEASNHIRVSLLLEGADVLASKSPELTRCMTTAFVDFTFLLTRRTNITVAIRIVEKNLGKARAQSTAQEEIQKSLLDSRYTVIEESKITGSVPEATVAGAISSANYHDVTRLLAPIADVVILGQVTAEERSSPYPQMFFSSGRAVIKIIDCKSGLVLGGVNLEDQKEGGPTYETAGARLLQKMGKKIGEQTKGEMDKALAE